MRLNLKAVALTSGIIWGIGVFATAWWLLLIEGSGVDGGFLARLYPGFQITPLGSLICLAWGAVDGLIGGAAFAWLYNKLAQSFAA
ncbi:MAG: hypothetical protein ACE5GA_02740 [Candidatus Zixiibacteriota bacterium]